MSAEHVLAAELAASLLSHEEKVRLAAKLAADVADAERPGIPSVAFAPVCWASVRLGMAVNEMDVLAEERADRLRFPAAEADAEARDGD